MNTRSLLILAAIAIALMLYLGLFGLKDPGSKEANSLAKQVFTFSGGDINRIELTTTEENILLVRGDQNKWSIEKPVQYPADQERIGRVVSELESAKRVATLDVNQFKNMEASLKQMGLIEPHIEIKIRSAEHAYQLAIGNETARQGNFYAQIKTGAESEIVVIGKEIEGMVDSDINGWRSKRIFDFDSTAVTAILLKNSGTDVELVKEGGEWVISRPYSGLTEAMSATSFLGGMLAARVESFASDSDTKLAEYGLSAPQTTLEITSGELSDILSIGMQVPDQENLYYAQVSSKNAVLRLTGEYVTQIKELLDRVREKRMIYLPLNEITGMKIQGKSASWSIEREGDFWKFASDGKKADLELVNQFYTKLSTAKGVEFFEKSEQNIADYKLSSPEWRITLHSVSVDTALESSEKNKQLIGISTEQDGYRYIDSGFVDFLIKFPAELLPEFPDTRISWLARQLELPATKLWKSISWDVSQVNLVIERESNGEWPVTWENRKLDLIFLQRQIELLSSMQIIERVPFNTEESLAGNEDLILVIRTNDESFKLRFATQGNRFVRLNVNGNNEGYLIQERDYQRLAVFPLDQSSGRNE